MVRLEKDRIVIEIETGCPADDLQELQRDIIRMIRYYDYRDYGENDGCPFIRVLDLLESTLPEFDFYKNLLKSKN